MAYQDRVENVIFPLENRTGGTGSNVCSETNKFCVQSIQIYYPAAELARRKRLTKNCCSLLRPNYTTPRTSNNGITAFGNASIRSIDVRPKLIIVLKLRASQSAACRFSNLSAINVFLDVIVREEY